MGIAWIPDPVAVRTLLAEMNTNVEDDPRGAQPLRIEQAHVVAGILHVPQVSHELLRVERPAFPVS